MFISLTQSMRFSFTLALGFVGGGTKETLEGKKPDMKVPIASTNLFAPLGENLQLLNWCCSWARNNKLIFINQHDI